ncbi:MAG TPA: cold shock domain-containing protein [archaeon]|jgi:CspA family cold shock protein|nr:cold shock domain-containing protein [archaeon]HRT02452.1 cold shock domain-containing protein [Candidatus Diapherotrites archaeon]
MEGTIKFYNFKKRFGFITGTDGKDYFVHESGLENKSNVKEGTKVSFEVTNDERGAKAVKVKVI